MPIGRTVMRRAVFVLFVVVGSLVAAVVPASAAEQSVFGYGDAPFQGSTGVARLNHPVVGMAATPSGDGYWLASREGRVFAFGAAELLGSASPAPTSPVVAIAATPSGHGYWLATASGGVHTFGDAVYFGSVGPVALSGPIVAIVPTLEGDGYWLIGSDGGVFTFGAARWFGSATGSLTPVADMAITGSGNGYWTVARDGTVSAFGDAEDLGSTGSVRLARSIVSIAATPTGRGYLLLAADGGLFTYGDARYLGSLGGNGLKEPAVDIVTMPVGDGYWLVTTGHLASSATANPSQVVLGPGSYAVTGLGPAVPGTYRAAAGTPACHWRRVGPNGLEIASGTARAVTIRSGDERFETDGCAPFVNEAFPARPSRSAAFGDGTWLVGADIGPWHWQATGGASCTWTRLRDLSGDADAVIETGDSDAVALGELDAGFVSHGCGTWSRS